jgi:flagellum-specific peptidoglycan hydrolase FlgJ
LGEVAVPASQQLLDLAGHYRDAAVEFGNLKGVTLASWILESGWGQSELARKHNNFAGMKYRPEMKRFAKKVRYQEHDGADDYCAFASIEA